MYICRPPVWGWFSHISTGCISLQVEGSQGATWRFTVEEASYMGSRWWLTGEDRTGRYLAETFSFGLGGKQMDFRELVLRGKTEGRLGDVLE